MEFVQFFILPLAFAAVVGWFGLRVERAVVSEVQSVVDAVVAQLVKVRDEIVGRLAEVEAQVSEAGVSEQVDLSGLQAIADALDSIVPDAVEEADLDEDVEYEGLVEFVEDEVAVDEPVEDEVVEEDTDK